MISAQPRQTRRIKPSKKCSEGGLFPGKHQHKIGGKPMTSNAWLGAAGVWKGGAGVVVSGRCLGCSRTMVVTYRLGGLANVMPCMASCEEGSREISELLSELSQSCLVKHGLIGEHKQDLKMSRWTTGQILASAHLGGVTLNSTSTPSHLTQLHTYPASSKSLACLTVYGLTTTVGS